MLSDYVEFFIPSLDLFHLQWTMGKCLFSAYQDAGLKDIFAVLGIDDDKWPGIRDWKDVHKSESLMNELQISLEAFFIKLYIGSLKDLSKLAFEACSDQEKSQWLLENLPKFLQELKTKDKTLSVWIDIYEGCSLVLMACRVLFFVATTIFNQF